MKNWLPLVFGPLFAIATVPAGYFAPTRFSSLKSYPGPPVPVPVGSPHCSTLREPFVSRWEGVLSKYFWPARLTKELTVHGAFERSSSTVTTLPSITRSTFEVGGVVGAVVAGAVTCRAGLGCGRYSQEAPWAF